jgi:hypothetical protein
MKRNAALETSSSVSFFKHLAGVRGPAIDRPTRVWSKRWMRTEAVLRQVLFEPAHVVALCRRRAPDHEIGRRHLGDGEVADQLAEFVQHRGQHDASHFGMVLVIRWTGRPPRPAGDTYLAKLAISVTPTRSRTAQHFRSDVRQIVGAVEGEDVVGFFALDGANQSGVSSPQLSPMTAWLRDHDVVERCGLLRAGGGQFLVGEADAEAAGIVLAHLGVGVAQRRPVAVAGDIHAPDVVARIAVHHPVGSVRPTPPPWLKPGHDGAGGPVVLQARTGPTSGLPSGAKVNGPLMICLMPAFSSAGKCSEADFQRRGDAVEIGRQQFVAEIPRRVDRRPGLAGLLVGAEQHALRSWRV